MASEATPPVPESTLLPEGVSWEVLQQTAERAVRRYAGHEPDEHENLVQECLVKLLRKLRSPDPPGDPVRYLVAIARGTVVDFIRRRQIAREIFEPLPDQWDPADPNVQTPGQIEDPIDAMRFLTLQWFRMNDSDCAELAVHRFDGKDWKVVAELVGRSHAAVRKQWSRCKRSLGDAVRQDVSFAPLREYYSA